MQVTIVGNGIVANLAALYLAQRLPSDVALSIVGPGSRGGIPVVGESTIEITSRFMEALGLGEYLAQSHFPKFALTYYFKLDPGNPHDRRYSVHCNERAPDDLEPIASWQGPMARPPAWQLNRDVFDRDIRQFVDDRGRIERINGTVSNVALDGSSDGPSRHRLQIELEDGSRRVHAADWIIDATGRKRLLGKHLGIVEKPREAQRDCFWFRLGGFEPELLSKLDALGPTPPAESDPYHYERYCTTHHFMGHGYWIWLIPLKSPDGGNLMSIGLSSRPDIYSHQIRSIEDFLEHVAREHPVVTDLVKSGTVLDTNRLANYRYNVRQVYSDNRWAIVGDAAFSPDALFTNGLAFSTVQLMQVGEMIARDHAGQHSPEYIAQLEKVFWTPVIGSQNTISAWYESMGDPLLSAARLNLIEVSYFYHLLPLIVNRCHIEPERLREWSFMQLSKGRPLELPKRLLELHDRIDCIHPTHFIYQGKAKVNPKALKEYDDLADMRRQMMAGTKLVNDYTDALAKAWSKQKPR